MPNRKHLTRFSCAAIAGLMALQSVACTSSERNSDRSVELRSAEDLSDEELFRELMFPNAEAAAKIPELARVYEFIGYESMSDEQQEAVAITTDMIVHNIQQTDPEFMQRFAEGITSGDVQRVEETMMDSRLVMKESLRMLGEDFDTLLKEDNVDALRDKLTGDVGEEAANMLMELKTLDPEILGLVVEGVHGHLADLGLPSTGMQIANAIDSQSNLAIQLEQSLDVSKQLQDAADLSIQSDIFELSDVNASIDTVSMLQIEATIEAESAIAVEAESSIVLPGPPVLDVDLAKENTIDLESSVSGGDFVAGPVAVAVAAVAVVIVIVAIVEWAHPLEGMSLFNGDHDQLFRDQMIANITEAYHRP